MKNIFRIVLIITYCIIITVSLTSCDNETPGLQSQPGSEPNGISNSKIPVSYTHLAYSKVGLNKTQLGFKESDSWCTGFIEYCARNVGYMISNVGYLTDTSRAVSYTHLKDVL